MCGKIVGQANMLARPSDPLTAPPPLSTDLLISYQPVIRCHYHNTMSTLAVCNTTPPPGLALVAKTSTDYYFLVLTHSMIRGQQVIMLTLTRIPVSLSIIEGGPE